MGLFKRGKIWWMSVVHQGQRIRESTGTSDRRLAEGILGKIRTRMIEGRFFEVGQEKERTFGEMMARYEEEHAVKLASQRTYCGFVKRLTAAFGDYTLVEITPSLLNQYKRRRHLDGVKPATINRELACMKKAFNLAMKEWQWCRENPVSRIAMEREHNARDRWVTVREEKTLLLACRPWLSDVVVFAIGTGMRMGEILELTWRGVDFDRRTVMVFRSKNGERRTIPTSDRVLDVLKERFKSRPLGMEFVFWSQNQTRLEGGHLRRSFRLALSKAKIEDFHFHDLRHTFATRLAQQGVDLYTIQRLLGHKSPHMTQRYAHHSPESLRWAVERASVTIQSQSDAVVMAGAV
ncbi:MAG TPA: tyrosine-type recombinase/integrase [Nitrospiraceae bacterium]|nr:tyrosine-type recombinase/integrase [Nitrospiraceae bacterium]